MVLCCARAEETTATTRASRAVMRTGRRKRKLCSCPGPNRSGRRGAGSQVRARPTAPSFTDDARPPSEGAQHPAPGVCVPLYQYRSDQSSHTLSTSDRPVSATHRRREVAFGVIIEIIEHVASDGKQAVLAASLTGRTAVTASAGGACLSS